MSYDVKFLKGIRENYDALLVKDPNTFYYVDESDLYLGEILLSNADEIAEAVKSINANASAIKDLQEELDRIVDPDGTGGGSISSQINTLRTELLNAIDDNTDLIKAEETRAKGVESGLQNTINDISTTVNGLGVTLGEHSEAIEELESGVSTLSETVSDHGTDILNLKDDIGELSPVVSGLSTSVSEHEAELTKLIGSDSNKSVRTIANEELTAALIPENAQEAMNELQEIAAWIQSHPGDAATMNANIVALQESDEAQDSAIESLQEAVNAINHAENGILAQAKAYTNTEISEISSAQEELSSAVIDLQSAVNAINDTKTGILAKAEDAIDLAIQELGLGSAAYKNVDYFEVAGAAEEALEAAKEYTNEALTWGEIPEASL